MSAPILKVKNVTTSFNIPTSGFFTKDLTLHAVRDVSFELNEGETLGIVGESGCGKSTLGKTILQLLNDHYQGSITFEGKKLGDLSAKELFEMRREMQVIFQDPLASLDPRMTVGQIIAEPLRSFAPDLNKAQRQEKVLKVMDEVGLLSEMLNRYPHEFSGGQAQRIGIARALISEPRLIICDEPVSALDVSIQAQIINLLMRLQKDRNLTLLFISHDLSVIHHISTKIMVLYLGRIVEIADKHDLYNHPKHPYTQALLSAAPIPDPKVAKVRQHIKLTGELPSPINPPAGCAFRTRCLYAQDACADTTPPLEEGPVKDHQIACLRWKELKA